jgi:hypothetical protein
MITFKHKYPPILSIVVFTLVVVKILDYSNELYPFFILHFSFWFHKAKPLIIYFSPKEFPITVCSLQF